MLLRHTVSLLVSFLVVLTDGALLRHGGNLRNATAPLARIPLANSTASHIQSKDATTKKTRPPRIYFLFLAVDKISNLKVWQNFFAQADPSQYRAFVHCKLPQCTKFVQGTVIQAVPTVPSYYCTDLVSPMNQLLAYSLMDEPGNTNARDKFVYISDSSLPAKPFTEMYATFSGRTGSDFCAFPSNEWADIPGVGGKEMAVKVHQWITLSRDHAERASTLWSQGKMHDFMQRFQMNMNAYVWSNNTYGDARNFGCLDEFWHMTALYGPLSHVDTSRNAVVQLDGFTNSPLSVQADAGWQGACDTFVIWAKYLHTPGNNPFHKLYQALDPASVPHGGNTQRPGWWDTISRTGIQALRNSDFLFIRKFIDNPALADGGDFSAEYSKIVLNR